MLDLIVLLIEIWIVSIIVIGVLYFITELVTILLLYILPLFEEE